METKTVLNKICIQLICFKKKHLGLQVGPQAGCLLCYRFVLPLFETGCQPKYRRSSVPHNSKRFKTNSRLQEKRTFRVYNPYKA